MKNMQWVFFLISVLVLGGCASSQSKKTEEAALRYQVSQQLFNKGEMIQGMTELLRAEMLDPKNSEIQNLLGLTYARREEWKLAEKHLANATRLNPKYSEAFNNLCSVQIRVKKYDDAIENCEKAASDMMYPTPERAYHNIGFVYEERGDVRKAKEAYHQALIHNPNFVMTRKALGKIYLGEKKYGKALRQYNAAAKACASAGKGAWGGQCPESYYQLGFLHMKLQQRRKAKISFSKCVKSDAVDGEFALKCRRNLKFLE